MKKSILIVVALLAHFVSVAQYSISGIVKDSANGNPLPSANMVIENSFKGTFTDNKGYFEIKNIREEKIRIRITFIGYKPFVSDVSVGENKPLEVTLQKDIVMADEVIITATRAGEKTATAYKNYNRQEIENRNFGQDIPFIFSHSPSVVVTSDAGNGIGYTGIRIRGSDPTRINVTINGIPVNDAESQLLYWVDMPDLASSIENIQIQRGVGTSTNGAGAFGGSVNIQTNSLRREAYAESNHAFGSFGTFKNNFNAGTGLVNNHWTFDVRLSAIKSDGYIDRASSDLKSIFISESYYGKKSIVKLNIFSGKEITYQSWYGTPQSRIENDVQGMIDYTIRNGLDSQDSLNLLASGRTYNYYMYKNQVDDYKQDNYQLHYSLEITPQITLSTSLHYTKGRGFYEEYKKNQHLPDYGIEDSLTGFVFENVNLVRRKWLDNDFYGATYSLNFNPKKNVTAILGGSWNQYAGDHFDELIWAEYLPTTAIPFQYEFNDAQKTDGNIFGKVIIDAGNKLSLYGDLQYRRVSYKYSKPPVDSNIPEKDVLNFFNPKIGVTVRIDDSQSAFISFGVGNKEPSRNDYINNPYNTFPIHETLYDAEAGYKFQAGKFFASANLYFMHYNNQLVLNGSLSDTGEPLRINVKQSHRTGIEIEGGWNISKKLLFYANATISQNKIKEYHEITWDYDVYVTDSALYKNTDISFSPNLIGFAELVFKPIKNFSVSISSKYTGKQFLDNTSNENRKLKEYVTANLQVNYSFSTKFLKEIRIGVLVNNLFDKLYESNGYTYSYIYGGETITENFYYPQAGTNILGQVSIKF